MRIHKANPHASVRMTVRLSVHQRLKPRFLLGCLYGTSGTRALPDLLLYAALKRRSSTGSHGSVRVACKIKIKVKGSGRGRPLYTSCRNHHFSQRTREMGHPTSVLS
jgi:hypothetical protein